jgi:hypothetical protein
MCPKIQSFASNRRFSHSISLISSFTTDLCVQNRQHFTSIPRLKSLSKTDQNKKTKTEGETCCANKNRSI